MGIYDQKTKLVNKTGQQIGFDVDHGICPLRDLPAGKSRSVSLNLIRKLCRRHGSPDWPIRVLINDRFYGMRLYPRHFLKMTRIIFRYKTRADESCVPTVEGVMETFYDRIFGYGVNWEKKIYIEILEADSTWCIRSSQDPNTAPLPITNENTINLPLRVMEDPDIGATPLIGSGETNSQGIRDIGDPDKGATPLIGSDEINSQHFREIEDHDIGATPLTGSGIINSQHMREHGDPGIGPMPLTGNCEITSQHVREIGDPDIIEATPLTGSGEINSQQARQARWRKINPYRIRLRRLWSGGGITSNVAATVRSRRRRLALLSLQRRDIMFNHFHLFIFALVIVGSVRLGLNIYYV